MPGMMRAEEFVTLPVPASEPLAVDWRLGNSTSISGPSATCEPKSGEDDARGSRVSLETSGALEGGAVCATSLGDGAGGGAVEAI